MPSCGIIVNGSTFCSTSQSSQEVDAETLRSILGEFESRMGSKWSAIGIQLKEFDLVRHLRSSDETGAVCVQRILDAWFRSGNEKVPVCAATISKVLRSEAVKLSGVAAEFEKVRCARVILDVLEG